MKKVVTRPAVYVRLTPELQRKLTAIAERETRPLTNLVEHVLRQWLDKQPAERAA